MSVYAISDLHLSFCKNKPMEVFGYNWKNHYLKIKESWSGYIRHEDTVLIPGDISWAKTLEEFYPDIDFIHRLPGKKVIIQGNHDYWWGSTAFLNGLYPDIFFLKNNFYPIYDFALCGTRGWLCPNDTRFTEHDEKIYKREAGRLKTSLDMAILAGYSKIMVMTHYPVTNDKKESSLFCGLIEQYPVIKVIYGHLHGKENFYSSYQGNINGVEYILVSADFLDFRPIKIL